MKGYYVKERRFYPIKRAQDLVKAQIRAAEEDERVFVILDSIGVSTPRPCGGEVQLMEAQQCKTCQRPFSSYVRRFNDLCGDCVRS